MAMDLEVIRRILIEGKTRGVSETVSELQKLSAAQEKVSQTSEKSERATLSVERSLERERRALDETYRATKQFETTRSNLARSYAQGQISQQEEGRLLALNVQRYNQHVQAVGSATHANDNFAKSSGLARHELVNLSRQAQDVVVSLGSGQGLGTVLLQQGTQIADVFATSTATVGSFFRQSIGWAGRFVTSAAGVTAGLVGIGAGALYLGQSFASAQRDIDRALSGIGAASGTTRGGINRIAGGAASPTGLSVSEAREAATAYAATGKIYEENIGRATAMTKDFAKAMGIDASAATKQLAQDLSGDLVAAALKWNATLGFADSKTLDYIQSLQSMGKRQEAINALISAAAPSIGRMSELTSKWGQAWDFVANKASNAAEAIGKATARGVQRVTGADLGGFTDQERLADLRQQRSTRSQGVFAGGLDAAAIRGLDAEISKLEQKIANLAKTSQDVRFGQMSLEARDFSRSVNENTAQVDRLSQGLANLEQVQAARVNRGGGVDPSLEQGAQIARVQLAISIEQEQVEVRKAQVFAQNALQYQNVSATTAQTLAQMQGQLSVAQAITGAAQIEATHRATINALLAQGKTLVDATAIADAQRAISLAQVNAEADRTLKNLQEQGQLIRAATEDEQARIKAAQEYNRLIEQGVDAQKAGAIAAQMQANARSVQDAREQAQADRDAASETERRAAASRAAAAAVEREAKAWEAIKISNARIIEQTKFVPFSFRNAGEPPLPFNTETFTTKSGGVSQFNPAGYKSTEASPVARFAEGAYGAGGYALEQGISPTLGRALPNAQGLENVVDRVLSGSRSREPGSISDAIDELINPALGRGSLLGDKNAGVVQSTAQTLSRLTALLPDDPSKMQAIWKQIQVLNDAPEKGLGQRELIAGLTQQLKDLQESTDKNTDALNAQLDPLFSQGHDYIDKLRMGFFENAEGGIMSKFGRIPLRHYDQGGITTRPSIFTTSENYQPEAIIPMKNGAVPVSLTNARNDNRPSDQRNYVYYGPGAITVLNEADRPSRMSARQRRQGFG